MECGNGRGRDAERLRACRHGEWKDITLRVWFSPGEGKLLHFGRVTEIVVPSLRRSGWHSSGWCLQGFTTLRQAAARRSEHQTAKGTTAGSDKPRAPGGRNRR